MAKEGLVVFVKGVTIRLQRRKKKIPNSKYVNALGADLIDHVSGLLCLLIPLGLINLTEKTGDQGLSSSCRSPLSKDHTPVKQMTTNSYPLDSGSGSYLLVLLGLRVVQLLLVSHLPY